MRTIKIYEPCEQCRGTGLEKAFNHLEGETYTVNCARCQGHGENIVTTVKEMEYQEEIKKATHGNE